MACKEAITTSDVEEAIKTHNLYVLSYIFKYELLKQQHFVYTKNFLHLLNNQLDGEDITLSAYALYYATPRKFMELCHLHHMCFTNKDDHIIKLMIQNSETNDDCLQKILLTLYFSKVTDQMIQTIIQYNSWRLLKEICKKFDYVHLFILKTIIKLHVQLMETKTDIDHITNLQCNLVQIYTQHHSPESHYMVFFWYLMYSVRCGKSIKNYDRILLAACQNELEQLFPDFE